MSYNNSYITDKRKIAYTYNVTTPAVNLPLTLAEVKNHLRIDADDASEDCYVTLLIETASEFGERYTGRDFINKTYTTFRNDFFEPLLLRRSKVSSVTSIEYLINNVFTSLSTATYGLENVNDYPYIYLKDNQQWPTNIDCIPQSVKIVFVSGFGALNTNIPSDIKLALLNHIAFLYENRGDCSGDCGGAMLPANSKTIYDKRRIINIGSYQKPASYYRL